MIYDLQKVDFISYVDTINWFTPNDIQDPLKHIKYVNPTNLENLSPMYKNICNELCILIAKEFNYKLMYTVYFALVKNKNSIISN